MNNSNEKIPNPKEIEKEIGDFLSKKFGDSVKIVSPIVLPQDAKHEPDDKATGSSNASIKFDLLPKDLVAFLDQYIVKQDKAKTVLATKICTHFNRIKQAEMAAEETCELVGGIKNNVLMIGPTGVGKTYMIKLIAKKIGVPFVKGDATKFSETGYVGGDVEDLVRDLLREADGDIDLAQYGIIYIDEIDKIASNRNLIGADVSRTGVQRALLKPMEETEVELKVPHDPIAMIQEIERFRKSGKREDRRINTKNILFIMSGAFSDLSEIVQKRLTKQAIGFGARLSESKDKYEILNFVKSEDLIEFGFESEFVGRLPVRAVFEYLTENDLYHILLNPNNPLVLGKKLDFKAYDIDIKFDDEALKLLAKQAFGENTGARGLVSAIEQALLLFENQLPSSFVKRFPVTLDVTTKQETALAQLMDSDQEEDIAQFYAKIAAKEKAVVKSYVESNKNKLSDKYNINLSAYRINLVAEYYSTHITDVENAVKKIKSYYDEVKKIELYFFNKQDINIVLEDDGVDYIIEQLATGAINFDALYKKLSNDFEHGLKLIREKTGRNRFFLTRDALKNPEQFLSALIKDELSGTES